MGSTRLPGKVLLPAGGKPFLLWQVERVRLSRLVDDVVVATSDSAADDAIAKFCEDREISVFRGPENDVLGRVSLLVEAYGADIHVELFGDSPLVDPQIIDEFVGLLLKYRPTTNVVTNTLKTTYPPGFDFLVYSGESLSELNRMVPSTDQFREHCGYNFSRFTDVFSILSIEAPSKISCVEYNFELDTREDYAVLCEVIERLSKNDSLDKSLAEILEFAHQHRSIFLRNKDVFRRWRELRH